MKELKNVTYQSKSGFKISKQAFVIYCPVERTYINCHGVELIENGFEIIEEKVVGYVKEKV